LHGANVIPIEERMNSSTLPLRISLSQGRAFPAYPADRAQPPDPVPVPWGLKALGSAECGAERLPDGRLSYWIRHDIVKGVTPRMLVWWFSNLEGDVVIAGQRVNRYRAWHPYDHVHASYARRRPDGSIGPGASIRLREYLGANRAYNVDTITDIEKLDEEGYIHNPRLHGAPGLVRMEYTWKRVPTGTLYENRLLVGGVRGWRRWITPLIRRYGFDHAHGLAWLRHNIEEVGQFEHFLPALYRQETDRED
jgi:hypothetical protein